MNIPVVNHDKERRCFTLLIDGSEAILEYRLLNNKAVDFYRTYVPPQLRGRGLAEVLVQAGLAWARQQEYQIIASCWYVQQFIEQ